MASIPPADIVIVNDGVTRWGASRSDLLSALDRLGWESRKAGLVTVWTEPEGSEPTDRDPWPANSTLCIAVPPLPGYGIDDDFDMDEFETFRFLHDRGGVWELG